MEHDARVKRGEFIGKSTEIKETFNFDSLVEVLVALKVYAVHHMPIYIGYV